MDPDAIAFDDAGRPVLVTEPEVYGEPEPERGGLDLEPVLLWFMAGARDAAEVGERLVLLAYLLRLDGAPQTLRELGCWLGCSHTAARRRVSTFRRIFAREIRETFPRFALLKAEF